MSVLNNSLHQFVFSCKNSINYTIKAQKVSLEACLVGREVKIISGEFVDFVEIVQSLKDITFKIIGIEIDSKSNIFLILDFRNKNSKELKVITTQVEFL